MSFVVAYWVPHNEGYVSGIIDGPGQDTEDRLVDLYEVDATIRSFGGRDEAQEWLNEQKREWGAKRMEDDDYNDRDEEDA